MQSHNQIIPTDDASSTANATCVAKYVIKYNYNITINKYCSVFVSNLTTNTKSADVVSFLHRKHGRRFKVVQIPSKFNDCVSFKVVVPVELKDIMLDKRNWTKNVYVREFFENSRGLANLLAKY